MPLQRRLFISRCADESQGRKADATNVTQKPTERGKPVRNVPPESLRERNAMLRFERIRIVTTFLDEEDSPKEGSSEKDVAEGGEGKEGSAGSLNGTQRSLNAPLEEVVTPGVTRRSQPAPDDGLMCTAATAMTDGQVGSLAQLNSPGRRPLLDSASRAYGLQPAKPHHVPAYRQSQFQQVASQEAVQAKEFNDRIMVALCKHSYQGVRQVERQVFLGGPLCPGSSLPTSHSPAAPGAANGARMRQDLLEGETPGPDEMLEMPPLDRQASQPDAD